MLKTICASSLSGLLALAMFATPAARGQALPAATGHGGGSQVGGGITYGKPDFGWKWIGGITAFGDYNFSSFLGVEGNMHFTNLYTPQDFGEETFEAGPRVSIRRGRFIPYVKGQIGYGRFSVKNLQNNPGEFDASSWMYSFGGGLDINATSHITVRFIDLEYQNWPNFANNGLTPIIGTVGIAYRFR